MAGRGVGMDVVRAEVTTLGGYVLTRTQSGKGSEFDLRVPLTTALTQVVILRCGELQVAVPASLVDTVLRLPNADLTKAYETGQLQAGVGAAKVQVPIYWLGGLLAHTDHPILHGKHAAVVLVHSGPDRIAIHVDEVIGNQEVVVKNLGPQLIHVPGLAGISLLASGAVALIYNPVALAERYGAVAIARAHAGGAEVIAPAVEMAPQAPLILVVDDSLTVRRVSPSASSNARASACNWPRTAWMRWSNWPARSCRRWCSPTSKCRAWTASTWCATSVPMPACWGLPVVMITSRIAEKHREYAAQLGVQGYLGKPYDEETLGAPDSPAHYGIGHRPPDALSNKPMGKVVDQLAELTGLQGP